MDNAVYKASLKQLHEAFPRKQAAHEKEHGRKGSCLVEDKLTGLRITRQYEHVKSGTQPRYQVLMANSPQDLILGQGYPKDNQPAFDKDELDDAVKGAEYNLAMIAAITK
jgi:hypothetical protein